MRYPVNFIGITTYYHFGKCLDFGYNNAHGGPNVPIYSIDNGTVISIQNQPAGGNTIYIEHDNKMVSCYNHLSKIIVKVGQRVAIGEQIGNMGDTGKVSGPHLHLGIYSSKAKALKYGNTDIDPFKYLEVYNDQEVGQTTLKLYGNKIKTHQEEKWIVGKYKLLVSKAIRTSHELKNNIVKVGNCMNSVKPNLTSTKATDNAYYKVGTDVNITEIYIDSTGRVWGKLQSCWIVLCNQDGTPQAKKCN